MRTLTRSALLAAVLAGLLLVSACSSNGEDVVAGGGDTPTSDTVGPDTATGVTVPGTVDGTAVTTWTRIEPTADLVDPVVAEPTEIVPDPDDDTTVLVHFYGGVQDCYGARATVVRQDETTVKIKLEAGSQPDLGDRPCPEIAQAQELAVQLDAPLGDREVSAVPARSQ